MLQWSVGWMSLYKRLFPSSLDMRALTLLALLLLHCVTTQAVSWYVYPCPAGYFVTAVKLWYGGNCGSTTDIRMTCTQKWGTLTQTVWLTPATGGAATGNEMTRSQGFDSLKYCNDGNGHTQSTYFYGGGTEYTPGALSSWPNTDAQCTPDVYRTCGGDFVTGLQYYGVDDVGTCIDALHVVCGSISCSSSSSCPGNTYMTDSTCNANRDIVCSTCPSDCPTDQYRSGCGGSSVGSCTVCAGCSAGQYRSGCSGTSAGSCTACASCSSGQYRSGCGGTSAGTCTQCSAGNYCPAGALSQTQCSSGTYCPAGSTAANACAAGNYCPTPSSQIACSVGKYCPSGSTVDNACAAGNYCPNTVSQTPCPATKYCPTTGLTAAVAICPKGSFCPVGSVNPTLCPLGSYCATTGLSASVICPVGSYCPAKTCP